MKSKTSFFSRTLFLSQLKRFWPIYAAYLAAVTVALPVALNAQLGGTAENGANIAEMTLTGSYYTLYSAAFSGAVICLVSAVMFAMAAFSYLYSARSVAMICSLPYKRTGVFMSLFTPGLCGMLLSNIIAVLIGLAISVSYGAVLVGPLLQWLAMMCLMNLFFYGFAALCASFTGHILVLPAVYIILNFTAYVVEYAVRLILETFVFGMNSSGDRFLTCLSPSLHIMFDYGVNEVYADPGNMASAVVGYQYSGFTSLLIYGAVGVLFTLIAMQLVKHRRMEAAKDVIAIKPLKPVFKYCMTFGCSLVIGLFLFYIVFGAYSNGSGLSVMLPMLAFMILGAFIGYFGSEMLIKKSLKVFKGKVWIGFAVCFTLIVGLMFFAVNDLFGYESYVPESEQIADVSVFCNGYSGVFSTEENIEAARELNRSIVSHKEDYQSPTGTYYTTNLQISYQLTDGRYVSRVYNLNISTEIPESMEDMALTEALLNSKEGVDFRNGLDFEVTEENIVSAYISCSGTTDNSNLSRSLTDAEASDLYNNAILLDMEAGNIGMAHIDYTVYDDHVSNYCTIDMTFYLPSHKVGSTVDYDDYAFRSFTPTAESTNTLRWLSIHGIELTTESAQNVDAATATIAMG